MLYLSPYDTEDLRRSGWNDATIEQAEVYTEKDPAAVARILHWTRPAKELGPCLVLPYFHSDGHRNGFARIKPSRPRIGDGGRKIKYEQPRGVSPLPLFTPLAVEAREKPAVPVAVTEGEKKGWAINQAGLACIALPGIWSWQKPKSDPRELVDDLAAVDWKCRPIPILFDTDPKRNPDVNQARAELARVLADLGAVVHLIDLPVGPRGQDGVPGKMAADDFIVEYGEEDFRRLVERAMAPPALFRSLTEYRADLANVRRESVGHPGVYLDTSPTGSGKTYADLPAAMAAKTSLTILPTHRNCQEVRETYLCSGLNAEAYPELNRKTCPNYDEATRALESGLSASAAVCPGCSFKNECDYRDTMKATEAADHRIGTHQRARMGIEGMAKGRHYVTIHESPIDLLRPVAEVVCGMDRVGEVSRAAKDFARDAEDMDLYGFFWRMEDGAAWLAEKLQETDSTTPLKLPVSSGSPRLVDARLFSAMKTTGIFPSADPLRVVKALAAGELNEITIRVDRVFSPGGDAVVKKAIIAVWQAKLPENAAVWLSDATADPAEIESLAGRPVVNKTPEGRLEQRHAAVQIPVDVKQGTIPGTVVNVLRGFFAAFPDVQQLGIICHRNHVPTIRGTAHKGPVLDESLRNRIAKIEYYHGGEGRGSNRWLDECDTILVLGTPRVPPPAVKLRLIQTGRALAAARDGEWDRDYWSGVTTGGKRQTVKTLAYRDHDWHSAHRALVRSELIQAVGRGRGICPNGLPVVVLSNENLGLPLLEIDLAPVSEKAIQALRTVSELSAQISKGESADDQEPTYRHKSLNSILLGICAVSSSQVALALGIKERRARYVLDDLLRRGLVERIGQRGGWKLTEAGKRLLSAPTPSEEPAAADSAETQTEAPDILRTSRGNAEERE